MYPRSSATLRSNKEDILETLLKSELEVTVSSRDGAMVKKKISELIAEAKAIGKDIIFTFTPGPFKTSGELPADWMTTPEALGCSLQLATFEGAVENINALVYAINKQTSEYQCGNTGLLAAKNLSKIKMISDADGTLQRELGLDVILVTGQEYLKRFSIAIKPNGTAELFELSSPVNPTSIAEHLAAISNFFSPQPVRVERSILTAMG